MALPKKYSFILSNLNDLSGFIEKILSHKKGIKLEADVLQDVPAIALNKKIIVDKNKLYNKDIFTNIYFITQYDLAQTKNSFLRNSFIYQNILFVLEFLFLILAFINILPNVQMIFLYLSIGCIVFSIFFSTYLFFRFKILFSKSMETSFRILKPDNVEQARIESLIDELPFRAFEYPVDLIWKLISFFNLK